jgi:spermidine/putrescine transport system substrate-binding protein
MKKHSQPIGSTRRRNVLKGIAAGGVLATGPWIVSPRVLASSGEVNVTMWSDYFSTEMLDKFRADTGITVNYTGIGSNEEIINRMKATKGRGIDLCSPTNMRSLQWVELDLLQPFDKSRLPSLENVNPAMLRVGDDEWNFGDKGPHWLPSVWGTEAIAWRTDLYSPPGAMPSYGNVWQPEVEGKAMIRAHSGMLGAGLYLETNGTLEPGDMRRAYNDEETMRRIWKVVTDFCVANKSQIRLFWNDADSQKNGFLNDGVIVGQTWDGPPLVLKSEGEPVHYQAPAEGALAWVDGMSLSAQADNVEQAYEFINYFYRPEFAGMGIDHHGYNSAVIGADQHAGDQYRSNFSEAYPGDALANLWPWPKEPQWYADVRTEFRNRFVNA